jgi:hypothetical protein
VTRPPDYARRLARALERAGDAAGIDLAWTAEESHPWASALFVGARHTLVAVAPTSPALAAFLAALPEADLPILGGHVADLVVASEAADGTTRTRLTALTIEG